MTLQKTLKKSQCLWLLIPPYTYTHTLLFLSPLTLPSALTPGSMPSSPPLTWMPPKQPLVSPSAGWGGSADPSRGKQSSMGRKCSPLQSARACLFGVQKVRKDGHENVSAQCPFRFRDCLQPITQWSINLWPSKATRHNSSLISLGSYCLLNIPHPAIENPNFFVINTIPTISFIFPVIPEAGLYLPIHLTP